MVRPAPSDFILVNRERSSYKVPYVDAFPATLDHPQIPGPPVVALNGQPQTKPAETGERILIIREGAGEGSHTNQWQRGTKVFVENIEGATGEVYTVTKADLGFSIRLVQTFSDGSKLYSNLITISDPLPPEWTNYDVYFHVIKKTSGVITVPSTTKIYNKAGDELPSGYDPEIGEEVIYASGLNQLKFERSTCDFKFGDITNTSKLRDLNRLFRDCIAFTGEGLEYFDISKVTLMKETFYKCEAFNRSLSFWDLSGVSEVNAMFRGCITFNQDLSHWNFSNVIYANNLFYGCTIFNQDLSSWDVSNVTDMFGMFAGCSVFNQNLDSWNVSKVTNMSYMFEHCTDFNKDLNSWDVSKVANTSRMFFGCTNFNGDISAWDVSNVTTMSNMFYGCSSFTTNIGSWNVGKVSTMTNMFFGCIIFNQDLGWWDVSVVTDMDYMFYNAFAFNADLSYWCVAYFKTGFLEPGRPQSFSTGASSWTLPKPNFGTCPAPKPGFPPA
jgi:surface protein